MQKWCIGIAGADDIEFRGRTHEPGPSAAKLREGRCFEFSLESLDIAKSIIIPMGEWSDRLATTIR
jgi:hypothetical protein